MMRALYTSATGMAAQQTNMDVIANNLANVNTAGFKLSRPDFQDMLYQQVQPAGAAVADGAQTPVGLEVGLGVKTAATETMFTEGSLQTTGNPTDMAIEGNGFFKVLLPDGTFAYTRDGSFKRDSQGLLVNSSGDALQPEITIPGDAKTISIGQDGTVSVTNASNAQQVLGKVKLTNFVNPAGLTHIGGNNFVESPASGTATEGTAGQTGFGILTGGELEMSNVQIVQEMVNMITAQRAYEVNSKSIQTADQMLGIANQLRQ